MIRRKSALLLMTVLSGLFAEPSEARLFFIPTDPALQGGATAPLDASSGFTVGQRQHNLLLGGLDLDFQTTHPQGFFGTFFSSPAFAARFPDGVTIDITPPAGAVGVEFGFAECTGAVRFEGVGATEVFNTTPGQFNLFIGAADIGDISRVRLEAGCFAAGFNEIRVVSGGAAPPQNEANLSIAKSGSPRVASQADGSITWTLNVTNAGPDDSAGARTIDFLPLGTNVVSANPLHVILAGTRLAQQGVGTVAPGASFPLTLETDIPPFHPDPSVASIFSCNSALRNTALTTATSIDPSTANNVTTALVHFDRSARFGFPEICDNAQDDDCDGRVDCSESSCASHPHCRPPLLPGPQAPRCLFGCPFPPTPPPPPPPACTTNNVHGRPVSVPSHCCALNGPRVNGRAPAECSVDPNFKTVDPPVDALGFGITSAGRVHDYTITYENVGTGDAFDVSVIDVLDPDLDDSTLAIQNGGSYDPVTRSIVWVDALPLPPFTPRTVSFAVAVRSDAPDFTAVRNVATIVFPNASPPEITDTNFVEHLIVPPGSFAVDPGVVGCAETAPGSGQWTVSLFNKGDAFGWNATAEILDPPASVDVSQGLLAFGALDDFAGSPNRSITPGNTTPSLGTVSFTTETPGDPCRTLTWRIHWEAKPGDPPLQRDVRVDPDGDDDAVTDGDDNCPDDYNPGQADSDGDGIGDVCAPVATLEPISDLAARAKSGKVDLTWTPPTGAVLYDVYRGNGGQALALIAAGHQAPFGVYADFNVIDGTRYTYEVVWRDAAGNASDPSNAAVATPRARTRPAPAPVCGSVGNEAVVLLAVLGGNRWWRRRPARRVPVEP